MGRGRAGPLTAVALALVLAGAAYFTSQLGFVRHDALSLALSAVAGALLVYLVLRVDPAWILSAGLAATMFAGHWEQLGLSTSVSPHRVLLAAGIIAVLLRAPGASDRPKIEWRPVHYVLAAAVGYTLVSAFAAGPPRGKKPAVPAARHLWLVAVHDVFLC